MTSRIRSIGRPSILVIGLLLAVNAASLVRAEGGIANPTENMCPNSTSSAAAKVKEEVLGKKRERLERALGAAEGSIQLFRQMRSEHMSGQRIWGIFHASDTAVGLITLGLDSVKTTANLIRDIAADVDPSLTIKALAKGSDLIESFVEVKSECDGGISPGEKSLLGFVADKAKMGSALNLGLNVCKTFERQTAHTSLAQTHRQVLAQFETELTRLEQRIRAIRPKIATIKSMQGGLDKQCFASNEDLSKKFADFAMQDAERSKRIDEIHQDTVLQSSARSREAANAAMKSFQDTAAQLQQQAREQAQFRSIENQNRSSKMEMIRTTQQVERPAPPRTESQGGVFWCEGNCRTEW